MIIVTIMNVSCMTLSESKQRTIARQCGVLGVMMKDYEQTTIIAQNPDIYYEKGTAEMFIGSHPSENRVRNYFLTRAAVHTAISLTLPEKWAEVWQANALIDTALCIMQNTDIGIESDMEINFRFTYTIPF